MSLINDALKKAQRQRDEGTAQNPETVSAEGAPEKLHRVARRDKPAGFRTQLLLIGGGAAAVVILLGLVAIFFFRTGDHSVAAPAQPAVVAAVPTAVATQPATPTPPSPAINPAAIAVNSPAAATPTPVPAPVQPFKIEPPASNPPATAITAPVATTQPATQFVLPPAPVAEVAPLPSSPTSAATPSAVERPKPSTRMIGVIEHYKVGGIRVSGTESKVLMNDKVYRLNDTVDYELGIRLTGIETKALTFEDARGAIHVRTF